ncbi:diaminopimelate epimerase [Schaalia suimastitidis]|uniref:diaminopimelate epimerase n=1 Tax=Schaalia suimastitidis TaxID=121163 RepID=UPI0004058951|nr:diaminopimelate epimerase [Schaalia suimastitidis]
MSNNAGEGLWPPDGISTAKVHGTSNTFIICDDAHDTWEPTAAQVRAMCSPTVGIGADGFIRCVYTDDIWFMDYRNADGSYAQMCGNGVRAFVHHLRHRGYIDLGVGDTLPVRTRGGLKKVQRLADRDGQAWYAVDMGAPVTNGTANMMVTVPGVDGIFEAVHVDIPNPHAVVAFDRREDLTAAVLPLCDADAAPPHMRPIYSPTPPDGINLELTVDITTHSEREGGYGHLVMRVLERGVGETASCGTGCCAAAVAAALRQGKGAPTHWLIDVPGGRIDVELRPDTVILMGPACHIADILW